MADEKDQPPRRKSRLRWLWRGLITVGVLLVLLFVIVQIALSTDLPRKLVIDGVQKALGLRVTAKDLGISWLGKTTLKDVTLALPLSEESFVSVPLLEVEHDWLPMIVIRRNVTVDSVLLQKPTLIVRQDERGRWNVQDVFVLIGRTGGSQSGKESTEKSPAAPKLPALTVDRATVVIDRGQDRKVEISPINLEGNPDGPLVYLYKLNVQDRLLVDGRVAPRDSFEHELELQVKPEVKEWVRPWTELNNDLFLHGKWSGRLAGGGVSGQMDLTKASFGDFTAGGAFRLQSGSGSLNIEPLEISLNEMAKLQSGVISTDFSTLSFEDLLIAAVGGHTRVNGKYDLSSGSGSVTAAWENIAAGGEFITNGSLTTELRQTLAGNPEMDIDLITKSISEAGEVDAHIRVEASGKSWTSLGGTVTAERFNGFYGKRKFNFTGSRAEIATSPTQFRIESITGPGILVGFGEYNFETRFWNAYVDGRSPDLPGGTRQNTQFIVNSWGKDHYVELKQLYLRDADLQVTAGGYYIGDLPQPVFLNVSVTQTGDTRPQAIQGTDDVAERAAGNLRGDERAPVTGEITGDAYVNGTLMAPTDLAINAWFRGKNLSVNQRPLGDITFDGKGSLQEVGRKRVLSLKTQDLELLQGKWRLSAESVSPFDRTRMRLAIDDLPLDEVGDLARNDDIAGTFDGNWTIDVDGFSKDGITVTGGFESTDFHAGPFIATRFTAQTKIQNGNVTIEPIELVNGDGKILVGATTTLDNPRRIHVKALAEQWPTGPITGWLNADLHVDLQAMGATGVVNTRAEIQLAGQKIGGVTTRISSLGRVIHMESFEARLFDGTAEGRASLDIDRPLEAVGRISWVNIDAQRIAQLVPGARDVNGTFGGYFAFAPATGTRPLGPLAAQFSLTPSADARFRNLSLGEANARLYLDAQQTLSDRATFRAVCDRASINVGGGTVGMWGRVSQYDVEVGDSVITGQLGLKLAALDLNEIAKAAIPSRTEPTPGQLDGAITIIVDSNHPKSLFGEGKFELSKTDLVRVPGFSHLYTFLGVVAGQPDQPIGRGGLDVRVEGDVVQVRNFRYSNRGVDFRGVADLDKLYELPHSPVEAHLAGSLRPFSSLRIPLLRDADEIISQLQKNVTGIVVTGTVEDPRVESRQLQQVGDALKALLATENTTTE